jgi:putative tryptophan/tyrosine transport system substrate-binding protein
LLDGQIGGLGAPCYPDGFVVLNDPFMFAYRRVLVDAASRFRLPWFGEFVDDGVMISYGTSVTDTYRRAAGYVDRILRGEKPANLSVQLPTKFELIINLKTSKAIGFPFRLILTARRRRRRFAQVHGLFFIVKTNFRQLSN